MTIDIEKLRALCETTIDAPWTVASSDEGKGRRSYRVLDGNGMWVAECDDAENDAAFIAAARTALPECLHTWQPILSWSGRYRCGSCEAVQRGRSGRCREHQG